jgi:hypothetical protein
MLSSPKQAALEVSAGSASSSGHGPNEVEGSPVKSRLVPSDCRSVTKPIYPAKSPVIRDSLKYSQPATTSGVQIFGSSHLIEAFHAMQLTGRALRNSGHFAFES